MNLNRKTLKGKFLTCKYLIQRQQRRSEIDTLRQHQEEKILRYARSIVTMDSCVNTKSEYTWFKGNSLYLEGPKRCSLLRAAKN